MSFMNNKIKLMVFSYDKNANISIDRIRENAACLLDHLPLENGAQNIGWVTGSSELDVTMPDEQIKVGENIYIAMRVATRRISSCLLKAVLRQKMDEYKKLNGVQFVPGKVRKELKTEAENRLIRNATPTIKTSFCVINPAVGKVYAGVASKTEVDLFLKLFFKTFGIMLEPMIGVVMNDADECEEMKHEFMTWLFRLSETEEADGIYTCPPFDFISLDEEKPCVRSVGYGPAAQHSPEVATALKNHKLLKKIKLAVTGEQINGFSGNDICYFTMNSNFSLVGLELPEGEEIEDTARFAEKIAMIDMLYSWLDGMMQQFCDEWNNDNEGFFDRKHLWLENYCG